MGRDVPKAGDKVGFAVGESVGDIVGESVVGESVGEIVGLCSIICVECDVWCVYCRRFGRIQDWAQSGITRWPDCWIESWLFGRQSRLIGGILSWISGIARWS